MKGKQISAVQLNKYETDLYFLPIFQSNMSVCLIISVFCKSCEPICEPEITPVLYYLENQQKSKQKQFHVQCSDHKSYKTRKWTSSCIGNFEENMDLSRIHLAVPRHFCVKKIEELEWVFVFKHFLFFGLSLQLKICIYNFFTYISNYILLYNYETFANEPGAKSWLAKRPFH